MDRPDMTATETDTALLPRQVGRTVLAVSALLVTFGVYLFVVRGPAMMLDLAQSAYNMFCQ